MNLMQLTSCNISGKCHAYRNLMRFSRQSHENWRKTTSLMRWELCVVLFDLAWNLTKLMKNISSLQVHRENLRTYSEHHDNLERISAEKSFIRTWLTNANLIWWKNQFWQSHWTRCDKCIKRTSYKPHEYLIRTSREPLEDLMRTCIVCGSHKNFTWSSQRSHENLMKI